MTTKSCKKYIVFMSSMQCKIVILYCHNQLPWFLLHYISCWLGLLTICTVKFITSTQDRAYTFISVQGALAKTDLVACSMLYIIGHMLTVI